MEQASGTKRTIGASIVLGIEVIKQVGGLFGLNLNCSPDEVNTVAQAVTLVTQAGGAVVLAWGTAINWLKRFGILKGK